MHFPTPTALTWCTLQTRWSEVAVSSAEQWKQQNHFSSGILRLPFLQLMEAGSSHHQNSAHLPLGFPTQSCFPLTVTVQQLISQSQPRVSLHKTICHPPSSACPQSSIAAFPSHIHTAWLFGLQLQQELLHRVKEPKKSPRYHGLPQTTSKECRDPISRIAGTALPAQTWSSPSSCNLQDLHTAENSRPRRPKPAMLCPQDGHLLLLGKCDNTYSPSHRRQVFTARCAATTIVFG